MSRRGNPYDNVQAESFLKTLKALGRRRQSGVFRQDFPPGEPDPLGTRTVRSGRDRQRRAGRPRIARLLHRQVNETDRLTVGPPRCETLVVIDTLPL